MHLLYTMFTDSISKKDFCKLQDTILKCLKEADINLGGMLIYSDLHVPIVTAHEYAVECVCIFVYMSTQLSIHHVFFPPPFLLLSLVDMLTSSLDVLGNIENDVKTQDCSMLFV